MDARSDINVRAGAPFPESTSEFLALRNASPDIRLRDVLVRHFRTCVDGQKALERIGPVSEKQSRTKRACNQCAKTKMRCDSQDPCSNCSQKYMRCEYSREGYSDPYSAFQIVQQDSTSEPTDVMDAQFAMNGQGAQDGSGASYSALDGSRDNSETQPLRSDLLDLNEMAADLDHFSSTDCNLADAENHPLDTAWYYSCDLSLDLGPFTTPFQTAVQPTVAPGFETAPLPLRGFQLHQIDSVEAKCLQMRRLLTDADSNAPQEEIEKYICRDNLITCLRLFGTDFQPNIPIMHLPTFNLIDTPPLLPLAMMLVGGCYASDLIPASFIQRTAKDIVILIESLPVSLKNTDYLI